VAGKVGFGQEKETGHPARFRELMPEAFADDMQLEASDDVSAQVSQQALIAQPLWAAAVRVYQPFGADFRAC
jgi:hypothetical protein